MGSNRKLVRAQARKSGKPASLNPLAALQQLKEVAGMTVGLQEQMDALKVLLETLEASRVELEDALETVQGLSGELVKQRATFLRMLIKATPTDELQALLEIEAALRAEYDSIREKTATNHEAFQIFMQGGM